MGQLKENLTNPIKRNIVVFILGYLALESYQRGMLTLLRVLTCECLAGLHKQPHHLEWRDSKQRVDPCCRSTDDAFIVRVVIAPVCSTVRAHPLVESGGSYDVQLSSGSLANQKMEGFGIFWCRAK
jgi:hypothetical protein